MEISQLSNAERIRRASDPFEHIGRRVYSTPRLTVFGNLRGITLGGSPGPSDSGQNNIRDMQFFTNDYNGIP